MTKSSSFKIAVLPGDCIGPEVMAEALKVLRAVGDRYRHDFAFREAPVGGAAWEACGEHLPKATLDVCETSGAILLGAVGGPVGDQLLPKWRDVAPRALLPLRRRFGLFANLRPAKLYPPLASSCPLRKGIAERGFDMLVVRELTGGIYYGEPRGRDLTGDHERAFDTMVYSRREIKSVKIIKKIHQRLFVTGADLNLRRER